jgi:hypothetical protein
MRSFCSCCEPNDIDILNMVRRTVSPMYVRSRGAPLPLLDIIDRRIEDLSVADYITRNQIRLPRDIRNQIRDYL